MRPVVLTILDGWGYSPQKVGNAIANAHTPNMDFVLANYPTLLLQASGKAVGMTWGESGNSEVGHLTIGAGRTIFQYLSRINKAIETGEFFNNQALMEAVNFGKKNNSKLHIAGLLTSGSVHAYFNHILTLLELANKNNISQIKLHLFTDGKDSGLKEGRQLLIKLDGYLKNYPNVKIATLIGRDFAMDRNDNWDLTEKAYNLMTQGQGDKTDNLIQKLGENYAVIFFNFREDSMRQIIKSFVEEDIIDFERKAINNLLVVGMTEYIKKPNLLVAFPIPEIKNS